MRGDWGHKELVLSLFVEMRFAKSLAGSSGLFRVGGSGNCALEGLAFFGFGSWNGRLLLHQEFFSLEELHLLPCGRPEVVRQRTKRTRQARSPVNSERFESQEHRKD